MRLLTTLRPRAEVLALVFGLLTAPAVAMAQTDQEVAARRVLLDHAEASRAAGRHAEALDLYLRAGRIQMTPSVRAFIAEEQSQTGQLVDALGSADQCLRELGGAATVNNREAIELHCRTLLNALRPRIGELVVRVPTPAPQGLQITVGGAVLNPALYDVPAAANPGDVDVVASVHGAERWRATAHIVAREAATVQIVLAPEPPATPTVTRPPDARAPARVVNPPGPTPTRSLDDPGRGFRTAAWVALGGAGAGVITGTVALIVQRVRAGEFNAQAYPVNDCGPQCVEQRTRAEAASTAAWAGYGVGIGLGVASAVLLLTAPSPTRRAVGRVRCGAGPVAAGASCMIEF